MWMFHADIQSVIHQKDFSREYKFARDVSISSIRMLSNIYLALLIYLNDFIKRQYLAKTSSTDRRE